MSRNAELNKIARQEGIIILDINCPKNKSMSLINDDGNCYIGIDNNMTVRNEIVHKAHELGHCITGSFYNRHTQLDIKTQHEYRADKWAIKKLIPRDELIEIFEKGMTNIWQVAEYFEVTEDFAKKACKFYGYYNETI